jgi:hypothetical protein
MLQDGFANDVWSFGLFLVEVLRPIVNPAAQKTRATLFHLLTEYRETEMDMAAVFGMLSLHGLPEWSVRPRLATSKTASTAAESTADECQTDWPLYHLKMVEDGLTDTNHKRDETIYHAHYVDSVSAECKMNKYHLDAPHHLDASHHSHCADDAKQEAVTVKPPWHDLCVPCIIDGGVFDTDSGEGRWVLWWICCVASHVPRV